MQISASLPALDRPGQPEGRELVLSAPGDEPEAARIVTRTRRSRIFVAALFVALCAIFGSALPASASSAYITDPTTTFLYTKNTWYYGGTMQAPATVSGSITNLQWHYQTSYPIPVGHIEYLCDTTWGQCIDVTSLGTGSSTAFNGRPARDIFQFAFAVSGTGSLSSYYFTGKNISVFY
jgi:hypothetical protein